MKTILFSFLLLAFTISLHAQPRPVTGMVMQDGTNKPLIGANVLLISLPDSAVVTGAVTDRNGSFYLRNGRRGSFTVKITYIGHLTTFLDVTVKDRGVDLGFITIPEDLVRMDPVEVTGQAPIAVLKGDTSEFHAEAYKIDPDATAEDLVRKMPGIVVTDKGVEAQGEEVKDIKMDGKRFFGNDPRAALRNIPANIIQRVQVYDQQSEQAQFTGFNDGDEIKAMNIITRASARNARFGRFYGGYGENSYYRTGANYSIFNGDQRWTFLAMSNNVNEQNFSSEDLLGVMSSGLRGFRGFGGRRGGRSRGGGPMRSFGGGSASDFLVDAQNGIATTHAFGVNYIDNWGKDIEVSGNYFFNYSDNEANNGLFREYVLPGSQGQLYSEDEIAETENMNHRLNMRIDWTIDEANSLLIRPRLSVQQNEGNSFARAETEQFRRLLNTSATEFASDLTGLNFSNELLYRHKFETEGRTISWGIENGYNHNSGDNTLYSDFVSYDSGTVSDTLDQWSDLLRDGWSVESSLRYTEPLAKHAQLMLRHDVSYNEDASDKKTWDRGVLQGGDDMLNATLSNEFTSEYLTNAASVGLRYDYGALNLNADLGYQWSSLQSDQVYPSAGTLKRTYGTFRPQARLRWDIAPNKDIHIFFRNRTQAPSVEKLQDVLDNSNPLLLSIGNPELEQSSSNFLGMRYKSTDLENGSYFFAFAAASVTDNYVGNSTTLAQKDTTLYGIPLASGTQLSRPENFDGQYTLRGFMTYGRPVSFLGSNLNINLSGTVSETPGRINGIENLSQTQSGGIGLVLASNISPDFDFTLSSDARYNWLQNSASTMSNTDYYSQTTRLRLNWIMWGGFVFNTNLAHQFYSGLSDTFNDDYLLWTVSFGKKVFPNETGEIRLTVYDVLGQNNSIVRSITDGYIEDARSNVLQRYVLLSFTWNLRHFGS